MALTERLAGFSSAAETVSSRSRSVLECIAGDRGRRAREALLAVLEIDGNAKGSAEAAGKLAQMRDSLAGIRRDFAHFMRVGPSFCVIATRARVETAHLGFGRLDVSHLADEFRSAGADIRAQVDCIINTVAALEKRIDATMQPLAALDAETLTAIRPLTAAAQGALEQFGIRQEQNAAGSPSRPRNAPGRLRISLPWFRCMTSRGSSRAYHRVAAPRRMPIAKRWLFPPERHGQSVIELQRAQLMNTANGFVDALRQIDQRLASIGRQVNAMVVESSALFGGGDSGGAFYSKTEVSFRGIARAVADCVEIERGANAESQELHHNLETLRHSTGEIHNVELRLRRLAVNGAIGAAHLGDAGEPLEAVASAMAQLLNESEASSAEAEAKISCTIEAIRTTAGNSRNSEASPEGAFIDRLRNEIDDLQDVNCESARQTSEIAQIASRLCHDVDALCSALTAQDLFASVAGRCLNALHRLKTAVASENEPPTANALLELDRRYTMREERDIQESVLKAPAAAPAAAAPAGSSPESGFGYSVELF